MLVLTRRVGEEIVIDGNIRITVVLVQGDKIRLGVTAPPYVRVDRQEVHERRTELTAEPQPRHVVKAPAETFLQSDSPKPSESPKRQALRIDPYRVDY